MPNVKKLPRGIRNNNPGNLRRAAIADTQSEIVDGYCYFRTPQDGLWNMAALLRSYYLHLRLRTCFDIIARWAPSTENDTNAYILFVSRRMGIRPGGEKIVDLQLTRQWRMIDMMRSIVAFENGPPSLGFDCGGEWFNAVEMWNAAARVVLP